MLSPRISNYQHASQSKRPPKELSTQHLSHQKREASEDPEYQRLQQMQRDQL